MNTTSLLSIGVATLAVSLFQTGCATVNTIEPAQTVAQRQMVSDQRIITDTGLYGRVRPVGINVANTADGFLRIQVEVQNLSSSPAAFAYRIEWFDADGLVIHTPLSAWINRQIQGGETLALTGIAPMTTAKDFRIKFIAK